MHMKKIIAAALLILSMTTWAWCQNPSAQMDRVQTASTVLSQIMSAPDRAIPDGILSGAKCIAIIPSMPEGEFHLRRELWQGRGHLPYGAWLERAGVL